MGPARMHNSNLSSLYDNAMHLHILYITYGYLKYWANLTIIFDMNNASTEEHANIVPLLPPSLYKSTSLISRRARKDNEPLDSFTYALKSSESRSKRP
jgi:hypothetical protein